MFMRPGGHNIQNGNMNQINTTCVSRRRKLDVEICDFPSHTNSKLKRTTFEDKQASYPATAMETDALLIPIQHQFPVNSFPLEGINNHMNGCSRPTNITPQPLSTLGPCSQQNLHKALMLVEHWQSPHNTNGNSCGGQNVPSVNYSENYVMAHCQPSPPHRGNCAECLSGKSGHFHHIRNKLHGLQE